ncbi:MAG: SsrA-binding protein SmpB [Patescibacteria group bacterium]
MQVVARNKKLHHSYEVLDTYMAGISLLGDEAKSLQTNTPSMDGAYITVQEEAGRYTILLREFHIPPYQVANSPSSNPRRDRILLLNKKEIIEIQKAVHNKGITLVPKAIGRANGKIKLELALVRGKKKHDKREDIKERDQERDVLREHKVRFR